MTWLFVVVGAVVIFVVAAVAVGREAFRLGHQPTATIFDVDEAVHAVADQLPERHQAILTYDEVRALVIAHLDHLRARGLLGLPGEEPAVPGGPIVVADDEAVAVVLGRADEQGLDVSDDDVVAVLDKLHAHMRDIGALGPRVPFPEDPEPGDPALRD